MRAYTPEQEREEEVALNSSMKEPSQDERDINKQFDQKVLQDIATHKQIRSTKTKVNNYFKG